MARTISVPSRGLYFLNNIKEAREKVYDFRPLSGTVFPKSTLVDGEVHR